MTALPSRWLTWLEWGVQLRTIGSWVSVVHQSLGALLTPEDLHGQRPWKFCQKSPSRLVLWETDFYPVPVPGGTLLSLWGCQTPVQYWIKIVHPRVQKILSCTGAGVWRKAPRASPDCSSVLQQLRVYLGAGSARPNPKMGAPDPEAPLFLEFSVLRGALRPWSQTKVSEGARPWGRGRSGDCEYWIDSSLRYWSMDGPVLLTDSDGRLIFYHYWCWRDGGAAQVKTSTGNNFPRKYQRMPRNYYQYWC